ncbi:hypothetical protein GGI12_004800 [Dipsacomyces acuminosporus]|nr:hypothetical protein GGI12_004800 [Dipsacomyces acuminosporus]
MKLLLAPLFIQATLGALASTSADDAPLSRSPSLQCQGNCQGSDDGASQNAIQELGGLIRDIFDAGDSATSAESPLLSPSPSSALPEQEFNTPVFDMIYNFINQQGEAEESQRPVYRVPLTSGWLHAASPSPSFVPDAVASASADREYDYDSDQVESASSPKKQNAGWMRQIQDEDRDEDLASQRQNDKEYEEATVTINYDLESLGDGISRAAHRLANNLGDIALQKDDGILEKARAGEA